VRIIRSDIRTRKIRIGVSHHRFDVFKNCRNSPSSLSLFFADFSIVNNKYNRSGH